MEKTAFMIITPRFWIANRVTRTSIDLLFRVTSANVLTAQARHRFIYGGIHPIAIKSTLKRVRNVASWSTSWTRTATEYLQHSDQAEEHGHVREAAHHRARAALCFHYAELFEFNDMERREALYAQAATHFRDAAPYLPTEPRRVEIPWRDITLPAYLQLPANSSSRNPVVVILNGASTVKEETVSWSEAFLSQGLATLSIDTPGSGEAWSRMPASPDQLDIAEALIRYAETDQQLDPRRVALLGISLRGAYAVQLAAAEPRIAATISVTAPFNPAPYFRHLNQIVQQEIAYTTHEQDLSRLYAMVESISLVDTAPRLTSPLLVIGAGNDLVVPSEESQRLYDAARGPKHLHFIPTANHVAFSHLRDWTPVAAEWVKNTLKARPKSAFYGAAT